MYCVLQGAPFLFHLFINTNIAAKSLLKYSSIYELVVVVMGRDVTFDLARDS